MSKKVIILGSTGSIGLNALELIQSMPELQAVALSCNSSTDILAKQIDQHQPLAVCSSDTNFSTDKSTVYHGADGLCQMIRDTEADIVLAAITGIAGLAPTLAAIESGKDIALANKEALVVAGPIFMDMARKYNVKILPVDSEHSAIFQAMGNGDALKTIFLTASGGPFLDKSPEDIKTASVAATLQHPTWEMGKKISVDSATMMNKALEILEACYLFDVKPEQIEVLIHPQSIIHSMVEFIDHSVIAQLGVPDMKLPIQFALTYPKRLPGIAPRLDLRKMGSLDFMAVDADKFPAIELAYDIARQGGTAGAVLNGANEQAVAKFLAEKISFPTIVELVKTVTARHTVINNPSLTDVIAADRWAREEVETCLT